jgi:molecular chaperone DnaJ
MNYYEVLGVPEDAAQEQIGEAYRKAAKQYHPDVNPDPEAVEKFKQAAEAYEVLNHPDKRAQYDHQRSGGGLFGGMPFNVPFGFGADLFGHRGPMGRSRTKIISVEITLAFEEAALGCKKDVKVKRREACPHCEEGVSEWQTCSVCQGKGQQVLHQGAFVIQTPCNACGGVGRAAKKQCDKCSGTGYGATVEETVTLDIPEGIENGSILDARGMGELGKDGRRGSLHIHVLVTPHPFYIRNGSNIFCHVPVTFSQLVLGTEIDIPTLKGQIKLTIPPGTSAGKKMRLRGMGIRNGDMYAVMDLDMPEMNDEYKKAIEKLAKLDYKYITSKRKEFQERVK